MNYLYLVAHPTYPDAPFACMAIDPKWADDTAKSVAKYIKAGCLVWRAEHVAGAPLLNAWLDMPAEKRKGLFDKRGKCVIPAEVA